MIKKKKQKQKKWREVKRDRDLRVSYRDEEREIGKIEKGVEKRWRERDLEGTEKSRRREATWRLPTAFKEAYLLSSFPGGCCS